MSNIYNLGNISTLDQYYFCERANIGGLSQNRMPYAKANLPDLKGFNPKLPKSHIYHNDFNTLYPSCMRFKLPMGYFVLDFFIIDMGLEDGINYIRTYEDELNIGLKLASVANRVKYNQSTTCFFQEMSGYFPNEIHDYLNDLPPLPENIIIDKLCPHNADKYDVLQSVRDL